MHNEFTRVTVAVDDLQFDRRNPRLMSNASDQNEALEFLALLEGPSCVELLKDIIKEGGISPLDNIGTVEEQGEYIVVEGNRRLLALLLLNGDEHAIKALPVNKQATVRRLLKKATLEIKKVEVVVFPNRMKAESWIAKKHASGQGGAGLKPWKAFQKDRDAYNRDPEKCNKALAFIYVARQESSQDPVFDEYLQIICEKNYSTLQRVVDSSHFFKVTNIEIDGTILITDRGPDYLVAVMLDICRALATKEYDSRSLHNQSDIKNFLEGIHAANLPKETEEKASLIANISDSSQNDDTGGFPASPAQDKYPQQEQIAGLPSISAAPKLKKPKALENLDCPYLGGKINALIKEARTLQISKYPEILATIYRVLLDLATDFYRDYHELDFSSLNLVQRVQKVLKDIDPSNAEMPRRVQDASEMQIIYQQFAESSPRLLQVGPHSHKAMMLIEYVENTDMMVRAALVAINDKLRQDQ